MDPIIESYRPADAPALRESFIQLQDHEHELSPDAAPGAAIADAYLAWMHRRCRDHDGLIGMARVDGEVVGFVTVLRQVERTDPDDPIPVHAYVSELAVNRGWRGKGIGAALLNWAEERAGESGAPELRVSAVAVNEGARRLYERQGYQPMMVLYGKTLTSQTDV